MSGYCVRCEHASTVAGEELCSLCVWAVRAEVAEGLDRIGDYLGKWAAFTEYLYERDPAKRARRAERRRRRSWIHRGVAA